jgi:hypothetical protein
MAVIRAMMMEAASTSETLVNFYQTTWHYNPEDNHLHTRHHENLKSYFILFTPHMLINFLKLPQEGSIIIYIGALVM